MLERSDWMIDNSLWEDNALALHYLCCIVSFKQLWRIGWSKWANWIEADNRQEEGRWKCSLLALFWLYAKFLPEFDQLLTSDASWSKRSIKYWVADNWPGKEDENALSLLHYPGCNCPCGRPRWQGGDWKGEQLDGDGGGGVNGDDGGGCGGYDCDDDQKRLKCLTMRRSQSALRTFVWRVDTGAGSTRNRIIGGPASQIITWNLSIWPKIFSVFLVEFDFEIVDVRKVKNSPQNLKHITFHLKVDTDIST